MLPLAIGSVLVVYGYLGGLWATRHPPIPKPLVVLRAWVNIPFGVGDDFGVLGTALLLCTAGYQVSAAARGASVADLVRAGSRSWLGSGILLFALSSVTFTGAHWFDWGGVSGYLCCAAALVLVGHVLQERDSARLHQWHAALLTLGCLATVGLASGSYTALAESWYPLTAVYALLIFLLALSRGHRVAAATPVRWLGSRGYALVAGTGALGYPLLTILRPQTPTALAYFVALLAMVCCAEGAMRVKRTVVRARSRPKR